MQTVGVIKLKDDAQMPSYGSEEAAGADIRAYGDYTLNPNEPVVINTGISLSIPKGFEVQVRSRSGMAKNGIIVANGVGTVDSDYQGELKVILANLCEVEQDIEHGDRIAQIVLVPVLRPVYDQQQSHPRRTIRGEGGMGSTGVS